jgi:hypothetical protein
VDVTVEAYKIKDGTKYGSVAYAEPKKAYVTNQCAEMPTVLGAFVGVVESVKSANRVSYIKLNCNPGFVSLTVWNTDLERNPVAEGDVLAGSGSAVFREYQDKLYTQIEFPAYQVEYSLMSSDGAQQKSAPAPKATANRRSRVATPALAAAENYDDIPF